MDFTNWNAREAAEKPRALTLKWIDGTDMMDGDKPCIVYVRGASSRSTQLALKAALKAKPKATSDDPRTVEDFQAESIESAKLLITGFENIDKGDQPLTVADAEWLLSKTMYSNRINPATGKIIAPSFAQQILECGGDDVGFFEAAGKP